jgi:glycosyltransferase involved in cell wall biosynthesis
VNASSAEVGGAVTFLAGWARALREKPSLHYRYTFLVNAGIREQVELDGDELAVREVLAGRPGLLRRALWDQVRLRALLTDRAGVLFSTANVGLLRSPIPQILLLRQSLYFSPDFMHRILPGRSLRARLVEQARRQYVMLSLRMADRILVPSQALRRALEGAAPEYHAKAVVVPYATDLPRGRLRPARGAAPFTFVFPSHYADYKNFRNLLRAARLLAQRGHRFKLRLNAEPEGFDPRLSAWHAEDCCLFRDSILVPILERVGAQNRDEVRASLQDADAVVIPSFAESFGHPFLEAMSQSLPIAASDLPIGHEVAGPAAIYFDPWSEVSIADAMERLMTDADLRDRLGRIGAERLNGSGWGRYIEAFEGVCSGLS